MRIKFEFNLDNDRLPIDYRTVILSYIKNALTEYDEGKYFDSYYADTIEKLFTFSTYIPDGKFNKDSITVRDKHFNVIFSTGDIQTGIILFNSFSLQKNKKYPLPFGNRMTLVNVSVMEEKVIRTNRILITFKSPLCVRKHSRENNRDFYYSYGREGFTKQLHEVLREQINKSNRLEKGVVDTFKIENVDLRKTVIKYHNICIESTIGTCYLEGDISLLDYLYKNGMGSKKSAGFGQFDIVGDYYEESI